MYRLARKRRLLYSVVQKSPVCRATSSGSEVTSSLQLVTSYPQCVTSCFQHVRGLHSTPLSLNLMERMAGVGSFRYDVILPDNDAKPETSFKDVGGHYEAKVELSEIVDFLKNRKKYTDLGAKIPSGALLSGPPGNGKTLLARAIAGEASVPFINTAGPNFIEKIGGLGPKRVREIFKVCKEHAPCILFIDEIDALASKRGGSGGIGMGSGQEDNEKTRTVNQLLVEMDGMYSRDEIFVIGATNRDDTLDSAVTRPGRLDRKVYIDNPTEIEREEIFKIHMATVKIGDNLKESYAARLAACTTGKSGADIANICNEAAIQAARQVKTSVEEADFEAALERITAGLERKSSSVSEEEIQLAAYYIAGQTFLSWVLPTLTPVLKASMVARVNNPLGFVQFAPRKELLATKEHLLDLVCRGLAGKASQMIFLDKHTTQAPE
ncbi:paraplegin-like [Bolinopsis microptera]|uniref:paraplegin-like n=1 Tax=Bolinopsis microptera TaxID=2820187 RepID=UPI00307ABBE0